MADELGRKRQNLTMEPSERPIETGMDDGGDGYLAWSDAEAITIGRSSVAMNTSAARFYFSNVFVAYRRQDKVALWISRFAPLLALTLLRMTSASDAGSIAPPMPRSQWLTLLRACGPHVGSSAKRSRSVSDVTLAKTQMGQPELLVVLAVPDQGRNPSFVLKITRNAGQVENIENTYRVLEALGACDDGGRVNGLPSPVRPAIVQGWTVYAESGLPGRSFYVTALRARFADAIVAQQFERAGEWLSRFHRETTAGSDRLEDMDVGGEVHRLLGAYREAALVPEPVEALFRSVSGLIAARKEQVIPTVCQHGDFWIRNIVGDNREMGIIDWEHARLRGRPFDDIFMFALSYGYAFERFAMPPGNQATGLTSAFDPGGAIYSHARKFIRESFAALGVGQSLSAIFLPIFLLEKAVLELRVGSNAAPGKPGRWCQTLSAFAQDSTLHYSMADERDHAL